MTQSQIPNLTVTETISVNSSPKNHKRLNKRLDINKGKSVKLVFNQSQVRFPCKAKIIDDSFNGCSLIIRDEWFSKCGLSLQKEQPFRTGKQLLILMKDIEPIKAEIMWSKELDVHNFRIGVKYLVSKVLKTKLFLKKTGFKYGFKV